ncbi:MAG: M3 family oligoendopeptidase [Acidimicrobiales bacterium]
MVVDPSQMDLSAEEVRWDLEPLLLGRSIEELLEEADNLAAELGSHRGRVAEFDSAELTAYMNTSAGLQSLLGRAGNYASLRFAVDTTDPENGARMQMVQERSTAIATQLLFFELEWLAIGDDAAEGLLADPALDFCRHHLRNLRRYQAHVLSEPEEKILTEKEITGASAWVRLFEELSSEISVELPSEAGQVTTTTLADALSRLTDPDRNTRRSTAEAITAGLEPGLRTRAYVFNTIAADKATDDRLRAYPSWISARNLSNEATDESVQALVDAVVGLYDIARRWYRLKARILGLERLTDYDRMATLASSEVTVGWREATDVVVDSYNSFSPELAAGARQFIDDGWIDAPAVNGKRPGAFCAYTVPDHHPYVLLNWTAQRRDILVLAHELGHGLHAMLARPQGIYHQFTPLTLAETASVFGETVTFERLLETTSDPSERLALLAESIEGSIATVFRQVAMNRFEHAVHTTRRDEGELSVETFGDLWVQSQVDLMGDAVEITDNYRSWWSYVPHFIGTPGYVYAYAYGQLLALSVYRRYQDQGESFIPQYLELLSAGGSMDPNELGRIVDCNLEDPSFWDAGLDLVEGQLVAAEEAAHQAGRL